MTSKDKFEARLPKYEGYRLRKWSVEEYVRLGPHDLDVLPRGVFETIGEPGWLVEKYAEGPRPRQFHEDQFRLLVASGLISQQEGAIWKDGYILVKDE